MRAMRDFLVFLPVMCMSMFLSCEKESSYVRPGKIDVGFMPDGMECAVRECFRRQDEAFIRERTDSALTERMRDISCGGISEEEARQILGLAREHASGYGFDYVTVLAVMAQESNFLSRARSRAGAVGLMQVTPAALRDYNRCNGTCLTRYDLNDDGINVMIGCWTLDRQRQYIGSDDWSECIISYNSGAGNFRRNRTSYLRGYAYLDKLRRYENMMRETCVYGTGETR